MSIIIEAEPEDLKEEYCVVCAALNIIPVEDYDAWQCYICGQSWWLEEMSKDKYTLRTGRSEEEAEIDLYNNSPILHIVKGQDA